MPNRPFEGGLGWSIASPGGVSPEMRLAFVTPPALGLAGSDRIRIDRTPLRRGPHHARRRVGPPARRRRRGDEGVRVSDTPALVHLAARARRGRGVGRRNRLFARARLEAEPRPNRRLRPLGGCIFCLVAAGYSTDRSELGRAIVQAQLPILVGLRLSSRATLLPQVAPGMPFVAGRGPGAGPTAGWGLGLSYRFSVDLALIPRSPRSTSRRDRRLSGAAESRSQWGRSRRLWSASSRLRPSSPTPGFAGLGRRRLPEA